MKFFRLLIVILWAQTLSAQTNGSLPLDINYKHKQAAWVLRQLEQQFQVKFSYPSDLLKDKTVTLQGQYNSLDAVLLDLSFLLNIDFQKLDKRYIYVVPSQSKPLKEVWVTGYLGKAIVKENNASFKINSKNWHLLPGFTEPDILEGIQNLPGVVSLDETATQFSVRGGTADQNRIVWDGINIYHGGHLFGLVSVFNPNISHRISFINKGTPVTFGERVSSVIDIKTSDKIVSKPNIEIGLNGISTDAIIKFPVIKNRLDIQASFRRSYEDFFETETFRLYEDKAFQNTKVQHEFFMFKDYNFKVNYKINQQNELHLSMIHIDNDLEHTYRREQTTYNDMLDSENDGFSIDWQTKFKHSSWQNSVSYSNYRFDYQYETYPDTANVSVFTKNNWVKDVNFLSYYEYHINKDKLWNFGYQLDYKSVNFIFKEQNQSLFVLDNDDRSIYSNAVFAAFHRKNFHNWDIYAGLRANYFLPVQVLKLEPRIVVNKKLNTYLKLQFTGELKHQVVTQINETVLSDLGLERKVWRLVDFDKFPIISAKQVSLGGIFQRKNWLIDLDFYYKHTDGISTLSLGFLNPADNSFHIGIRKAFGIDLFIRKKINANLKTWLGYSFMDVREQYEGLNNGKSFPAHTTASHILSLSTSYYYKRFELAAAWKIHTGKPYTELETEDDDSDELFSYFETINSDILPLYHRLDFSGVYKFNIFKKIRAKAGLSIKNIYNQKSLINIEYMGNNQPNAPIQIRKYYTIGMIPNFVFRLKW